MRRDWLKRFTGSLVVLATAAVIPTLAFASTTVEAAANDTVITGKIKSNLAVNQVTHAQHISVDTNDGVVTLRGTAQSATEAAKAIEIAESTPGVKSVDATQLTVKNSPQPMTDTYITAKIKGVFLRNNLTPGELNVPLVNVNVETQNGVVYLKGFVESVEQRAKLIQLAKTVEGVTDVKSDLSFKK